jgi:hypothetical protein
MSAPDSNVNAKQQDLTLAEISEKYKDRWVAIEVTKRDKNFQPLKGRVLESDVDRYRLREKTAKYEDLCIFYGGESQYRLLL